MSVTRVLVKIEAGLAHAVGALARACAARPWTTVWVFLAVTLGLTAGLIQVDLQLAGEDLWWDPDSLIQSNTEFVRAMFGEQIRTELVVVRSKTPGGNVVSLEAMREALELHEEIMGIRTEVGGLGIKDLCAAAPAGNLTCQLSGPLRLWMFDLDRFEASETSDATVARTCANPLYPDGQPVIRGLDFGRFELEDDEGESARAAGFQVVYFLENQAGVLDWEAAFSEVTQRPREHISVLGFAESAIDVELEKGVFVDAPLMGVAFGIMIVFASLTLGKTCSRRNGRAGVAVADVLSIVLSTSAAYGTAALIGIPFTAMAQLLPYVLVAIGIDNSYVVAAAFDRADPVLPVEQQVYEAVRRAGLSITLTTFTDLFAFLFCSFTTFPSITFFGQYGCLCIVAIYFAHLTFFPAVLVLDARRRAAGRADLLCCIELDGDEPDEATSQAAGAAPVSGLARLFRDYYGPALVHPVSKVLVVCSFTALFGLGLWQATLLDTSFDLRSLAPDTSYLNEVYDVLTELWGTYYPGMRTGLYLRNRDLSSYQVQADLRELVDRVLELDSIDDTLGSLDWHGVFSQWARATGVFNASLSQDGRFVLGAAFAPAVAQFLRVPQFQRFAGDVVFGDDGSSVVASRIIFFHADLVDSVDYVAALEETQGVTRTSAFDNEDAFLLDMRGGEYANFEHHSIIVEEAFSTIAFSVVAVAMVTAILLVHPVMVVLVMGTVAMIFTVILGSLPMWDLSLNSITMVNLVLAIALVVDYSAHIAFTFGTQDPSKSRDERVVATLGEIGPAVLLGAATTVLGTSALGFASSEVFRTFFKSFLTIVVVGGGYGLVWLPVVLSLVGPAIDRKSNVGGGMGPGKELTTVSAPNPRHSSSDNGIRASSSSSSSSDEGINSNINK